MEQRKIGSQGLVAGAIGLGCMGMTHAYGVGDEAESQRRLFGGVLYPHPLEDAGQRVREGRRYGQDIDHGSRVDSTGRPSHAMQLAHSAGPADRDAPAGSSHRERQEAARLPVVQRRAALEVGTEQCIGARQVAALQEIVAKVPLPKERLSGTVRIGGIYHEILGEAADWGADLIVIGSHRPVVIDYLLGSNAKTIVRHALCSVLVVRP